MDRITPERLESLLDRMRGLKVLVVGDLMLDVYLRGGASRISPEAPVPVVKIDEEWRAVGGAANVAANAAALGADVDLVGAVGRDGAGRELLAELERAGIGLRGVCQTEARPTTVKTRVLVQHHQVARYDREVDSQVDAELGRALIMQIDALTPLADAIVLEDYDKGVLAPQVARAALDAAARHHKPIVVDPKFRNFLGYAGATIFKPNLIELAAGLREEVQIGDPAWLEATRRRLGCRHLLVTLGEAGMVLISEDAQVVRVPAIARAVYDVSGAGDTVTAVLATALAAEATPAEAAVLANHAAALEVGKAGVATVAPEELRESVARMQDDWRATTQVASP